MPPQNNNSNGYPQPTGPVPQYPTGSTPHRINMFLIPFVLTFIFLLIAGGVATWAFMERDTYKNHTDEVVAKEVAVATQQKSDEKDKEFIEKEKAPYREYKSPSDYGSISIIYPKTWSAHVVETNNGSAPVDGYFHPSFVPGAQSGTAFAARLQVSEQSYEQETKAFDSKIKTGKIVAKPYQAAKVAGIAGIRFEGEINQGQNGIMVIFPLRDKTIKISTQSMQFAGDFDTIILANLTFVP